MLEPNLVMNSLYNGIADTVKSCGFAPVLPEGAPRGASPVYMRDTACVMDLAGEKGR